MSVRLVQVLRVYRAGLDARTLADLRAGIEAGRYPWLRDEFATAVRTDAFTGESWGTAVTLDPSRRASDGSVRQQQERVWAALFPDEPFPHRGGETVDGAASGMARPAAARPATTVVVDPSPVADVTAARVTPNRRRLVARAGHLVVMYQR